MLFSFLSIVAHVAKALTYWCVIGNVKLTPNCLQNSLYNFHAEQCLAQVGFEAEYSIRLLKLSHSAWNSGASSSYGFNISFTALLWDDENFAEDTFGENSS